MLDMQQKIKIFKALGNETRFLIFKNVFTGGYTCSIDEKVPKENANPHTTCVTTIAQHFDFSLPTISKHLQLLREANIIKMQKKGNKIYIEPNIEIIEELGNCFTTLIENFERNRELFFDEVKPN
ncbi:MAG: transcriptional regulator [Sulfurimonas sp. RIFCSPHIGHO2_12_FULL_36_9]|uniref:ArsR/SmtB family transcription factor n=1 Tax=unclassified Sulfurimonas TaxID=2623549 RepID=UPI0008AEA8A2|nr:MULTISPECIES: metalloregulator ArsR/SmtB family transcription factor [unclassified Sulfurimonas]OHD99296.1 MAG: transcriptional regulator [Sulfurimonas sp. RIFCSPHIGHO2_12_FULL_36_9]OHE01509.1 MAG: transcriptional regulator [Sulfurimonas sp. RIFCSPLOWO2_12_36_12]OHE07796.1 MAG: transcriptional regulator [Sulfurimonas sp. RIFCSPLOWO2_12_FULL_36_74]